MTVGQAGEVGADDRWCCRDRDEAVRGAPVGKMAPVRLVGAQGGGSRCLLRQRLGERAREGGGGECRRARLGQCGQWGGETAVSRAPAGMLSPIGVIV
jgi:hypothetical protein